MLTWYVVTPVRLRYKIQVSDELVVGIDRAARLMEEVAVFVPSKNTVVFSYMVMSDS